MTDGAGVVWNWIGAPKKGDGFKALRIWSIFIPKIGGRLNYFTSSDPHHDMLGEGCQVGVVRVNWKCYFPNS